MIAGAHDEQRIADAMDKPTVTSKALELQEAAIRQGQALARGEQQAAAHYHSKGLLIIGEIRKMAGEDVASES